jgi:transmembrane sensor
MSSERAPSTPRLTREGGSSEPLGPLLRDGLDEPRIQSMWQRIDHTPARRSGLWLALASAAIVGLLLFGVTRWLAPKNSGQLALVSGSAPIVLGAEERSEASRFEDGSQISLQKGSRLEVLRNDAGSFVTVLRRGAVTFDVQPGGKRHWVIEAGDVTVEVVGTRFRVARQGEVTKVTVDHGVVLVRGERVAGGATRLTAGQSFTLRPVSAPSLPSAEPMTTAAPPPPPSHNARLLTAAPIDVVAGELSAADEARQRGDTARAIRHFEAAWSSTATGDARRGLIALSLARLLIGQNPAKAARLLRSSLSEMPSALLEDAQARLVEAESRAGNRAAAQHAADDYRKRFPAGQRLHEVERWSAP